jgi:uncharacterized protein (DUF1800 family)
MIAEDLVAHVMRRVGFGVRPDELTTLAALPTYEALVDLVTAAPAASTELLDYTAATVTYFGLDKVEHPAMNRMANAPAGEVLTEKVAFLCHDHFATSVNRVESTRDMWRQFETFRRLGLGSFRSLVRAVCNDPAMLVYLDGDASVAGNPNENLGRELMELFTLGVDNYSQDDVTSASRCLTGWNACWEPTLPANGKGRSFKDYQDATRYPQGSPEHRYHDRGTKTIFGRTGNFSGDDLIGLIVDGPMETTCARHIARTFFSNLAYPRPAATVVNEIADAYLANGKTIRALVRAILLHPEFRSTTARNGLVKTPVEFAAQAMRAFNVPASAAMDWNQGIRLANTAQRLFYAPNIAGWPQNGYWASTSAVGARADWAWHFALKVGMQGPSAQPALYALASRSATDVATGVFRLLGVPASVVSATTRQIVADTVTAERAARWGDKYVLMAALTAAMTSPEYQTN